MSVRRPGFRGRLHPHAFWTLFGLVLVCGLSLLLAGCDDDDPYRPHRPSTDLTGIVLHAGGVPAEGASVYLAREPDFMPAAAAIVVDSLLADGRGRFAFTDLAPGRYRAYAGVWNRAGEDFFEVSPFCDPVLVEEAPGKEAARAIDLLLWEIRTDGVIAGKALYWDGNTEVPADSAQIRLFRHLGGQLVMQQETRATKTGDFALPGVPTGNYALTANLVMMGEGPFPLYVAAESPSFFCDGRNLVRVEPLLLSDIAVEKPAIYLYPPAAGPCRARLELNHLVRLTASIPDYGPQDGQGWQVFAEPSGRLDGRYDYLFYEVAMRGAPLLREGWCLAAAELEPGLRRIVRQLGLSDREAADFLDYWLTRLPRRPFILVRPLLDRAGVADLDALAALHVEPRPDAVLRFWLFFAGADAPQDLPEPQFEPFVRRGFTAVEWGGAVVQAGPGAGASGD